MNSTLPFKDKNEFLKFYIRDHENQDDFFASLSDFFKQLENYSDEEIMYLYQQYCSGMKKINTNTRDLFGELQNINHIPELLHFLRIMNERNLKKELKNSNNSNISTSFSFNSGFSPYLKIKFERFFDCIKNIDKYSTKQVSASGINGGLGNSGKRSNSKNITRVTQLKSEVTFI